MSMIFLSSGAARTLSAYLLLQKKVPKKGWLLLLLLVTVCTMAAHYFLLASLLVLWGGLFAFDFFLDGDLKKAAYLSSLSLLLSILAKKAADQLFRSFHPVSASGTLSLLLHLAVLLMLTATAKDITQRRIANNDLVYWPITTGLISCLIYLLPKLYFFHFSTATTIELAVLFFVLMTTAVLVAGLLLQQKLLSVRLAQVKTQQEYQALKQYLQEMEKYNEEVKRFRHDHQNILTSIELFIIQEDLPGLKAYYETAVKGESLILRQKIAQLSDLEKIAAVPLKSLLINKLLQAQEQGLKVTFEAKEPIIAIAVEPLLLVRIFGIILDNAIEELVCLGRGELRVAAFYQGSELIFIFENSCHEEMPSLAQLQQPGYSTKGSDRGKGLEILNTLTARSAQIYLETTIANGLFLQKLIIS